MTAEEFIALLAGVRKNGSGWSALCPAHPDRENSLSIGLGKDNCILVKCFAGCSAEAIVKAVGRELKDLFAARDGSRRRGRRKERAHHSVKGESQELPGLMLKALSEAKKLPEAFLRELGIHDCMHDGAPAVRIPYLNPEGEIVAVRFRLAMTGQRFSWRKGDKLTIYGLQRLKEITAAGWVLLVEGESDCWTAWLHALPALGIPGKSTWKEAWRDYLVGLQVYLWQEPDAQDLTRRIYQDIPGLNVIQAPSGMKDISEAYLQGQDIRKLLESLKAQAIPVARIFREEENDRISKLMELVAPVLNAHDPLELVKDAILKRGYGGNIRYPLIVYLAVTSRLLAMRTGAMPVHLLLLGVSSAGKSYTLKLVLILLPAAAFHVIDAGSPRVLIYDSADLRHRVVVFSEADSLPAGEDNPAASAIRNLLQDHNLHYKVPVRDPETGDFVIRDVDKPGPSVLITTAVKRLGPQLDTRLFTLEVPDDQDQVRKALQTQAEIELLGVPDPDPILVAFQEYLQALAPWDVVVPFVKGLSEAIGKSLAAPRILRDFQRLISLIKSVTILRHAHRERDSKGRLVATIDDYRVVFDLVQEMYEASATGASQAVRAAVGAVAALRKEGKSPVSVSMVAERLGRNKGTVSRCVRVALREGWLCNTETKKGFPADLVVGEPLPARSGLPDPGGVAVLQRKPMDAEGSVEGTI